MSIIWHVRSVGTLMCLLSMSLLSGCVAQQADLKSAERRFKESNEALAQRGAQQRQELEELKSHELPKPARAAQGVGRPLARSPRRER